MFLEMKKYQCMKLIFKSHFQWPVPPRFKLWCIRENFLQRFEKLIIRLRIKPFFRDIKCFHFCFNSLLYLYFITRRQKIFIYFVKQKMNIFLFFLSHFTCKNLTGHYCYPIELKDFFLPRIIIFSVNPKHFW